MNLQKELLDLVKQLAVGQQATAAIGQFNTDELEANLADTDKLVNEMTADVASLLGRVIELERRQEEGYARTKYLKGAMADVQKQLEGFAKRTAEDQRQINRLAELLEAHQIIVKKVAERMDALDGKKKAPRRGPFGRYTPDQRDGGSLSLGETVGEEAPKKPEKPAKKGVHHNTKIENVGALSTRTRNILTREGIHHVRDLKQFVERHGTWSALAELPGMGDTGLDEIRAVFMP